MSRGGALQFAARRQPLPAVCRHLQHLHGALSRQPRAHALHALRCHQRRVCFGLFQGLEGLHASHAQCDRRGENGRGAARSGRPPLRRPLLSQHFGRGALAQLLSPRRRARRRGHGESGPRLGQIYCGRRSHAARLPGSSGARVADVRHRDGAARNANALLRPRLEEHGRELLGGRRLQSPAPAHQSGRCRRRAAVHRLDIQPHRPSDLSRSVSRRAKNHQFRRRLGARRRAAPANHARGAANGRRSHAPTGGDRVRCRNRCKKPQLCVLSAANSPHGRRAHGGEHRSFGHRSRARALAQRQCLGPRQFRRPDRCGLCEDRRLFGRQQPADRRGDRTPQCRFPGRGAPLCAHRPRSLGIERPLARGAREVARHLSRAAHC